MTVRPHGWYWWFGVSNEVDGEGKRRLQPRWHAVHCWIACDAGRTAYADSAHFVSPMTQEDMSASGTWGPEINPPKA